MVKPGTLESHQKPVEGHHSLKPGDQSLVYWKFGGSTVMTKDLIRIVPSNQNRKGWLWNDYPLESEDWEIEVVFRAGSSPHYGGDGWALWILSGDHDPMYHWEPDYLNGNVFGLRDDFRGFGVIFDTYDNDAKRDNPSISVVQNYAGRLVFDHENDFSNVMIRNTAEQGGAFKCYSNYLNTKEPVSVLFRFVKKVLHVYVQDGSKGSNGRSDYKFCLAVPIDLPASFSEKHIALTGMTGQVADRFDLIQIATHYLDDKDAVINDQLLQHAEGRPGYRFGVVFWLLLFGSTVILIFWTWRDITLIRSLRNPQTHPVYLCNEINRLVMPHVGLHFLQCGLLFFAGTWLGFILNLPILCYRIYSFLTRSYYLEPAALTGAVQRSFLSYFNKLVLVVINYTICSFYYFYKTLTS